MIKGFFFDGIDAVAAGPPVGGKYDLIVLIGADKAEATLAFAEFTKPWANVALNAPVLQSLPIFGRDDAIWFFLLVHLRRFGAARIGTYMGTKTPGFNHI